MSLKTRVNKLEICYPISQQTYTREQHAADWNEAFDLCGIVDGKPEAYPTIPIVLVGVSPDPSEPDTYALPFYRAA